MQVSKLPLLNQQQQQPLQLLGLAVAAADWMTGQQLPLPLLCSLMPHGDVALSLLQSQQVAEVAQPLQASAVSLLLPAAARAGGAEAEAEDDVDGAERAAVASADVGLLLPYVKGVPPAVVSIMAAGELR